MKEKKINLKSENGQILKTDMETTKAFNTFFSNVFQTFLDF